MATSKKPMVKSKTNIATRVVRTAKKALVDPLSMVPKSKPKATPKATPKAKKKAAPKRPVMPAKINPFKMTPAQKAEFLRNPKAYE